MNEVSFLLDLFLNHKMSKSAREAVTARIKEIAERASQQQDYAPRVVLQRPPKTAQSPSTQKILDEMAAEGAPLEARVAQAQADPVPLEQIAQTPAAAAAMAARAEAIRIAASGKEEKGRTAPRKY